MNWNEELEERLLHLRLLDLDGALTTDEKDELDRLMQSLENEETVQLASAFAHLKTEQAQLQEELSAQQTENESLHRIYDEQTLLIKDARQWLSKFEKRHRQILQNYTQLTGRTLVP
jgi:uncharacterized membrane protein YcjF (UPF0283 family)